MKAYYRLLQYEFSTWFRAIILLCIIAIITPLYLLNSAMKDYNEYAVIERFENIYASSGSIIVFLVCIAAACVYFLKTIYANYWGSKSVYMYLSLPVRRETIYFSKLTVFVICLLMLLGAQLISIRLGYEVVATKIEGLSEGRLTMTNGLFLSFIRSDFFRMIMPFGFSRVLSSICILLTIVTSLYYGALCERSKRYWWLLVIGAAVIIVVKVLNYRMNESLLIVTPSQLYPSSIMLLLLSGFFMWQSIRLIKNGAIA